jgi:hypothetical protein
MPKLRTNKDRLVMVAVQGQVAPPQQWEIFEVDHKGKPFALPSTGGITYNVKVGDSVFGWAGDHIEPGVSTYCDLKSNKAVAGYQFFACVGNEARLVSGDAKGKKGVVTGHHGGVEHVMIDFPQGVLEKISQDDKILIKAYGQGIQLLDFPEIRVVNTDPNLLAKLPMRANGGRLEVGVTHIVPGGIMGSGVGAMDVGRGDYDIMTHDQGMVKKHNLESLRFGDVVAIMDHDNMYGRTYRKGAVTIGTVIHSNSFLAGHGPGVTTLMSSAKPKIKPVLNPSANVARILKIGTYR